MRRRSFLKAIGAALTLPVAGKVVVEEKATAETPKPKRKRKKPPTEKRRIHVKFWNEEEVYTLDNPCVECTDEELARIIFRTRSEVFGMRPRVGDALRFIRPSVFKPWNPADETPEYFTYEPVTATLVTYKVHPPSIS